MCNLETRIGERARTRGHVHNSKATDEGSREKSHVHNSERRISREEPHAQQRTKDLERRAKCTTANKGSQEKSHVHTSYNMSSSSDESVSQPAKRAKNAYSQREQRGKEAHSETAYMITLSSSDESAVGQPVMSLYHQRAFSEYTGHGEEVIL